MKKHEFRRGDRFNTPSGTITISAISLKEARKHGTGYKVGKFVFPFEEFEKNVKSGIWTKIGGQP